MSFETSKKGKKRKNCKINSQKWKIHKKSALRAAIPYCAGGFVSVTLKPKTVAMNKSYKKFSLVQCDSPSQVVAFTSAQKIIDKMFGGIEKISTFAPSEPAKPLSDAQIGGSFYIKRGAV